MPLLSIAEHWVRAPPEPQLICVRTLRLKLKFDILPLFRIFVAFHVGLATFVGPDALGRRASALAWLLGPFHAAKPQRWKAEQ